LKYELVELDLKNLSETKRKSLQSLTTAQFYGCLSASDPFEIENAEVIGICAYDGNQPIGLLLASCYIFLRQIDIHSIFINEEHREKTIGTQILNFFEKVIKSKKKLATICFVYPSNESTLFLEKILKKNGWVLPKPYVIHCSLDAFAFNPPWYRSEVPFSSQFQLFPWKNLTTKEKERIQFLIEQRGISSTVAPCNDIENIEGINSLGLRYEGEVIGWMITHRVGTDTIRYTSLFIFKEFRFHSTGIKLLIHAIQLQKKSHVQFAFFQVNLEEVDKKWIVFVKKRLIPYSIHSFLFKKTWKIID
jgi:GNAT superfamily N-acetyltransferase